MKAGKNSLLFVSVLAMAGIWGFIAAYRSGYVPAGLEIFIFLLIMVAGIYAFVVQMRIHKDIESGFPADDELSMQIKYKAGYLAFTSSIYVWLALFLFKEWVTDYDTLFGIGVLLPAVMFIAIRSYLSRNYSEDAN